jgi:hypothetical protein
MCNAIEGVTSGATSVPNESGVGLPAALDNYASWFKNEYLPGGESSSRICRLAHNSPNPTVGCASYGYAEWQDTMNVDCFDSYNATSPIFTDYSAGNPSDRQWYWMTCNEPFFYWQT